MVTVFSLDRQPKRPTGNLEGLEFVDASSLLRGG
jgi:hypothetical protein